MKTVILAGGLGTRIAEEGDKRPKPMVEIGGQPILWHIMKYYSSFGFDEFVVCCGYKGHMIKEYFANYYLHRCDITFDFRDDNKMTVHSNIAEPWRVTLVDTGQSTMTGGRVRRVEEYVRNEQFFLTYGDGVSNVDLNALLSYHNDNNGTVTITAVQPGGRYGLIDFDERFNVKGFREKTKEDGGWINAGFMVCEPELFSLLDGDECTLEFAPFEKLSAEGQMSAYRHYGFWQCMDTQRDRGVLEAYWQEGNAPWKVWK